MTHQDKVLVVKRSKRSTRPGEWESPAGHIDDGESAAEAAVREVKEETGLKVKLDKETVPISLREKGSAVMFRARLVNASTAPQVKLNPYEHSEHKWVDVADLDDIKPCPPKFAQNIKKLLEKTQA